MRGRRSAAAVGMYEMEGQGCITPASLKRMLGRRGSDRGVHECRAMICRFDLNGDRRALLRRVRHHDERRLIECFSPPSVLVVIQDIYRVM
jgi:hypothetical protein